MTKRKLLLILLPILLLSLLCCWFFSDSYSLSVLSNNTKINFGIEMPKGGTVTHESITPRSFLTQDFIALNVIQYEAPPVSRQITWRTLTEQDITKIQTLLDNHMAALIAQNELTEEALACQPPLNRCSVFQITNRNTLWLLYDEASYTIYLIADM